MQQLRSKQFRLIAILFVILCSLFASAWFLHYNFKILSDEEFWVSHTSQVLASLDESLSSARNAETSMRGYLLTGNRSYLDTFETAKTNAVDGLMHVNILVQDNPIQVERVPVAIETLKKRLQLLTELQNRYQKDQGKIDKNLFQVTEGKAVMEQLKSQIEKMKETEQSLMKKRTEQTDQSRSLFVVILAISMGFTAIVVIVAFVQISNSQTKTVMEAMEKNEEAKEKEFLSDLSRAIAGDISSEQAGTAVLKFLSDRLGILAGKLWIRDSRSLSLSSSYGVGEDKDKSKTSNVLVETALDKKGIWQVTDVPANYWKITSGFGSSVPNVLTFLPFLFQGRQIGVLELATFGGLSEDAAKFLPRLSETIGVGMNAAISRTHLQALLEKTQQQSEELQSQQEELRTNNEELEQQARALESQQQALNIKNKELEFTQVELETKAADLHRSGQYKSEFLAKMSHELRTPLNGLLILSTLLVENKEKNLTDQQKQFAKSIGSAGNDLLTLVNDILDLSKIEARKLSLRAEEFSLKDLFRSKRLSFEPQTNAKGLKFEITLAPELEKLNLYTDRQRVEQVLRNFLSNAIKFTEKGQITLSASLSSDKKRIKFSVADTGIGIPKHKQSAIFEAFEQADSSVSRKYGGTGLGLTISRELASLLGGKIDLQSEEGKGSEFSFEIPVNLDTVSESDQSQIENPKPYNSADEPKVQTNNERIHSSVTKALDHLVSEKKKILIVEDDDTFRASIVEAVQSYGFDAIEAADGEVALAILGVHIPDAILLDIKLPGISGLGILEMIKQLPHLRHIPIHMISALEYQNNALRMGAFGYLTKPVTIEKVRSALGRIEDQISKKLRRVLLIEDDDVQNLAISQLIGGSDLEVVSAKTGKSAVEKIKSAGFDCIILDLTLPDVSGFDVLSELRALEISLPPVVIYTGKDLSDDEERYLRKYSESIVIKGARSPERLLDEVNLFLHRVESLLPEAKREMLSHLRSQEKNFEGKTILVVDDDIRNVFALTSALESKGLQVRVARDGIEALEQLSSHSDIDLVLMDIMMPRMDGFEAMKHIREDKDERIKSLPVVALTAKAMKEDHEKCMNAGASDYLPKPVNLENLTTVLKVWLSPKGFIS